MATFERYVESKFWRYLLMQNTLVLSDEHLDLY